MSDDTHLRDPGLFLRLARFLRAQADAQDFSRYTKDDLMQLELGAQIMALVSGRVRAKVDEQWALRGGRKMLRELAGEKPFPRDLKDGNDERGPIQNPKSKI